MPDQSTAAEEHALMSQITEPLRTLPDDPVGDVAETEFPTVLRGYDKFAVDAYVKRTNQLLAELQSRSTPQAAVRRAVERVGEDVSGILQRAHETAESITAQSRRESENRLEVARREAAEITAKARARVKELDADTDRIWAERDRIVGDARDLARQLVELAEEASARFPADDAEAAGAASVAASTGAEPAGPTYAELEPESDEAEAVVAPTAEHEALDAAEALDTGEGAATESTGGDDVVVAGPEEQATPFAAPAMEDQATEAFEPFDVETRESQALPGELRFSRGPGHDIPARQHGPWGRGA
jgi:cell division septum initiation protein DivIVA